eukprot:scaffold1514_cov118-Cylindrotheca_fusiformis.AAC.6
MTYANPIHWHSLYQSATSEPLAVIALGGVGFIREIESLDSTYVRAFLPPMMSPRCQHPSLLLAILTFLIGEQ